MCSIHQHRDALVGGYNTHMAGPVSFGCNNPLNIFKVYQGNIRREQFVCDEYTRLIDVLERVLP
jgi:hypothetical protein